MEERLHHDEVLGVTLDRDRVRAEEAAEERVAAREHVLVVRGQQLAQPRMLATLESLDHEAAVDRPEEEAATLACAEAEERRGRVALALKP